MPYAMRKVGKKWLVEKADTGKKVAEHATQGDAEAQIRLLHGVEHGWKPTRGKNKKKSG